MKRFSKLLVFSLLQCALVFGMFMAGYLVGYRAGTYDGWLIHYPAIRTGNEVHPMMSDGGGS